MSDLAHESDVVVKVYFRRPTAEKKGYISAYTSYSKREGEDWNRGNDLADGGWEQETVDRVKRDIDRVFAEQKAIESASSASTNGTKLPLLSVLLECRDFLECEPSTRYYREYGLKKKLNAVIAQQ